MEKERQQILVGDIWKARKNKESLIAQKARVQWGKKGDLNTKFFHLCVNERRRRNKIHALQIGKRCVEEVEEIKASVNEGLVNAFLEDEVGRMILECEGDKNSKPDGLNFVFLKRFWGVIKVEVMNMLAEFFRNEKLPKSLLSYFVALVPKVERGSGFNNLITTISLYPRKEHIR
ncbi:uncharacterized protein LOC113850935 [Abrus precatorius]|uniref:Uncharacterized protein LOC113850935 n=1 Tax=Abrus precatorius TaxID=3816 RepID=A0A8B8K0S3_ABRPR|nr:uncharacterized protein LOC113850935 [Abrus precatorius]